MASTPDYNSMTDAVPGEPAWNVALLFPPQGSWTEADYLELESSRMVEYSAGCVEVLDMPTKAHQRIVRFLFQVLSQFVAASDLGEVFFAPMPVRLWAEKFREPDLIFVRHDRAEYRGYPEGADLVIEVVSEGDANRRRDLETKREEYSRAGIAEYWIVDPTSETITVLSGVGDNYGQEQVFSREAVAESSSLAGFRVSVEQVLAAANVSR